MARRDWDIDLLPPDRLQWPDVAELVATDEGYPSCPVVGCGDPAELATWNGPRCRNHGDVIEPDAFALNAMAAS